tara:strand:+ start:2280 stop:2927 length:648 start_codon:yes stop_codon:yes gene_type:complete
MAYTFGTLKTAIQDYTENTESTFVSQLSRFIINAEERIFKEVQLDVFRKYTTGTTQQNNKFLTKPTDILSPLSLSVVNGSSNEFLLYKHSTFLQDFTPNPATSGIPIYYADWDDTAFILAPTPSSALTMELHYYYRPASITAGEDSGTTWLGDNAQLALLYGSLVEAYTFMKGDEGLLNIYNGRFQEAMRWLKNLGEGRNTRDQYRYDRLRREVE